MTLRDLINSILPEGETFYSMETNKNTDVLPKELNYELAKSEYFNDDGIDHKNKKIFILGGE